MADILACCLNAFSFLASFRHHVVMQRGMLTPLLRVFRQFQLFVRSVTASHSVRYVTE